MTKCLVCHTGKLEQSGCHVYCTNCSFSQFAMTDDYMAASTALLGTLLSNTKFPDNQSVADTITAYISRHLPALDGWLSTLTRGIPETMNELVGLTMAQSINLQIEDEVINEEKNNDLVCSCGCNLFTNDPSKASWNHLVCGDCGIQYYSDEATFGEYFPYFACVTCGHNAYTQMQGDTLSTCDQCSEPYVHDAIHGIFRMVLPK